MSDVRLLAELSAEHRTIEAALIVLDREFRAGAPAVAETFALVRRHADREERALFPQLLGSKRRLAETMEGEHLYLEGMMDRITRAVAAGDLSMAHDIFREFHDLIGRHMQAEDVELLEP